jgi:hypothetical protein
MVRTALQREEFYQAHYLSAQYQAALTAVESLAKTDYASFVNDWVVKRDLTIEELNSAGIPTLKWGAYLAFSSLLWKLTQIASGDAASAVAAVYVAEWVARGLTLAVLEGIRTNVYNIAAPVV